MRIYQERTDMNLVCLMSGGMPAAKNEIAIDRMYADNNKLKVGDKLKIAGEELTVTGLVALPDYSCLFSDNSDMMFDAVKFGVGIMTEKGADAFGTTHLEYRYSWQYETAPKDDIEAKNMSEDFLEVLVKYGNIVEQKFSSGISGSTQSPDHRSFFCNGIICCNCKHKSNDDDQNIQQHLHHSLITAHIFTGKSDGLIGIGR